MAVASFLPWTQLLCVSLVLGCPALDGGDPEGTFRPVPGSTAMTEGDAGGALRSLLLPGWGQFRQEQRHWWVYPVVEGIALAGWYEGRSAGDRNRARYRDLAWEEARRPIWSGSREEGPWEYYERMARWYASGQFDRSPEMARLDPETDPSTYNGWIWQLARQLHFPVNPGDPEPEEGSPEYRRALDYYRERAVPPAFAWDWSGSPEARARFRGFINASDDGFRRATGFLGLVFLNHFISAAEGWLSTTPGPLERIPIRIGADLLGPEPLGAVTLRLRITSRNSRSHR